MIKDACAGVPFIFRAGVWKPRTSPYSFQGIGDEALAWLAEIKRTMGLEVATEVATADHVKAAAEAGIDYLWVGARTGADPIAVQKLADTIAFSHGEVKALLIKNPVNADDRLWMGNIERLEKTGLPVIAVHRGCNHHPCWAMAHSLRVQRPDIPLLIDPSHMSGKADCIEPLMDKAAGLGYNGCMIEVHPDPANALSDARQQITPDKITNLIGVLSEFCRSFVGVMSGSEHVSELAWLRAEIDELDDDLWETIAKRMNVSRRIGEYKKAHNMAPLQPERYKQILKERTLWATGNNLSEEFAIQLFDMIHAESVKTQS